MSTRTQNTDLLNLALPNVAPAEEDRMTYPKLKDEVLFPLLAGLPSDEDFSSVQSDSVLTFKTDKTYVRNVDGSSQNTSAYTISLDAAAAAMNVAIIRHNAATPPTITGATYAAGSYIPNADNYIVVTLLEKTNGTAPTRIVFQYGFGSGINLQAPNQNLPYVLSYDTTTKSWKPFSINGKTVRQYSASELGLSVDPIEVVYRDPFVFTSGNQSITYAHFGALIILDITTSSVSLNTDYANSTKESFWFDVLVYNPTRAANTAFITSSDGIVDNDESPLIGTFDAGQATITEHGVYTRFYIPNGGGSAGAKVWKSSYLMDSTNRRIVEKFRGAYADLSELANQVPNPETNDFAIVPGKLLVFDGSNWVSQFEGTAQSIYAGKYVQLDLSSTLFTAPPPVTNLDNYNTDSKLPNGLIDVIVGDTTWVGAEIVLPSLTDFTENATLAFRVSTTLTSGISYPFIQISSQALDSSPIDEEPQGWTLDSFKLGLDSTYAYIVFRSAGGVKWVVDYTINGTNLFAQDIATKTVIARVDTGTGPSSAVPFDTFMSSAVQNYNSAAEGDPIVKTATGIGAGTWPLGGSTQAPAQTIFGNAGNSQATATALSADQVAEILRFGSALGAANGDIIQSLGSKQFGFVTRRNLEKIRPVTLTEGTTVSWDYAAGNFAYLEISANAMIPDITNMEANEFAIIKWKVTADNAKLTLFPSTGYAYYGSIEEQPADSTTGTIFQATILKLGVGPDTWDVTIIEGGNAAANTAPTASVSLTGGINVGTNISGTYTYSDADSDAEGASVYSLRRYDTPGGAYGAGTEIHGGATSGIISSSTALIYTLDTPDQGKYIKLFVRPIAATGSTDGAWTASSEIGPIGAALANSPEYSFLTSTFLTPQNAFSTSAYTKTFPTALSLGTPGTNRKHMVAVSYMRTGSAGSTSVGATTLTVGGVSYDLIAKDYRANGDQPGLAIFQCLEASIPTSGTLDVITGFDFTPQDIRVEHFLFTDAAQVAAGSVPFSVFDWNSAFTTIDVPAVTTANSGVLFQQVCLSGTSFPITATDGQTQRRTGYSSGTYNGTYTNYVTGSGGKNARLASSPGSTGVTVLLYLESV